MNCRSSSSDWSRSACAAGSLDGATGSLDGASNDWNSAIAGLAASSRDGCCCGFRDRAALNCCTSAEKDDAVSDCRKLGIMITKSSATSARNPMVAAMRPVMPNGALDRSSSRVSAESSSTACAPGSRRSDSWRDSCPDSCPDSWLDSWTFSLAFVASCEPRGVDGLTAPVARTGLFSGSSTRDNRVSTFRATSAVPND